MEDTNETELFDLKVEMVEMVQIDKIIDDDLELDEVVVDLVEVVELFSLLTLSEQHLLAMYLDEQVVILEQIQVGCEL